MRLIFYPPALFCDFIISPSIPSVNRLFLKKVIISIFWVQFFHLTFIKICVIIILHKNSEGGGNAMEKTKSLKFKDLQNYALEPVSYYMKTFDDSFEGMGMHQHQYFEIMYAHSGGFTLEIFKE